MWPKHEFGPRRAAPGLRPDSQRAGHQAGPSRSPTWALFGPGHRGIKTGDAGVSRNPSDSFSLPLLSPRDAAAATERRRRPWRPRRRGRSGAVVACSPVCALAGGGARRLRARHGWRLAFEPARMRPGVPAASGRASCPAPRRSGLRGSVPHEGGRLWGGAGQYPPPFALGLGLGFRLFFSFSICIELLFLCLDSFDS